MGWDGLTLVSFHGYIFRMTKLRVLDGCCCEGGAGMGYHRAGFDVTGVDLENQPNYPFTFIMADIVDYIYAHGKEYDLIHVSPPCQAYSTMTANPNKHPMLIDPVRKALIAIGVPYIIENVDGARWALNDPIRLCGSSFNLRVRRHRWFENNMNLQGKPCDHKNQSQVIGVYGQHPDKREYFRPDGTRRGAKAISNEDASDALGGVDWMTWNGMRECIPPAYTEFLGRQAYELIHGMNSSPARD